MRFSTILPLFFLPLFATAAPPVPDVKDDSVQSFIEELTGDTFEAAAAKGIWYAPNEDKPRLISLKVRETLFTVLQTL